ncbi:MAG: hypothetical protein R6V07_11330 [Armatimonadota bacterium]
MAEVDRIIAADEQQVARAGAWVETTHRYAEDRHLATAEDGAALTLRFRGSGLAMRLGRHAVPAYGPPDLGTLIVSIDDGPEQRIRPLAEAREVVLARDLPSAEHTARIEHRASDHGSGARIEAFRVSDGPTGEIAFALTGEQNAHLVDARAIVTRDGERVAPRLVRNPLTGQCRLTGLPPGAGYRLELRAIGWEPAVVESISVEAGRETQLPPVHLAADPATVACGWRFPHIGRQAVRRPGESFRARLQARDAQIAGARVERRVGPATISRPLSIEEDAAAAYYYDREVVATLPEDTPSGIYDLTVSVRLPDVGVLRDFRSPRSVTVVAEYPADPVFATWGHLDTQAQYQAEYLRELVQIANLAGADMVLMANACNPAYVAGALAELDIPHAVNFGNHQSPGFEQWFGPQEGVIDLGPDLCVLNRSLSWYEGTARADALLAARDGARMKVINAFEPNAPTDLLDRHGVALVHDGHGPGARVMEMGATPTLRVGKSSSESFRMIRFRGGRVASCTYMGDATAPIPFPRGDSPPLRLSVDPPADGTRAEVEATITNDLGESFPNCRMVLVMPGGDYACEGGHIEQAAVSDCGQYVVLTVRADGPAQREAIIRIQPEAD